MRNIITTNNSSNIYGAIMGSEKESLEEANRKVPGASGSSDLLVDLTEEYKTPKGRIITGADPFKRAPKLRRSPIKTLSVERPERAKSPPPALQENNEKAAQSGNDTLTLLGEMIGKLTEAMRLPQRSINNNIRELLETITKLHSKAQEEAKSREAKRNVLGSVMAEGTPKRPRDDKQPGRKTPPKKSKTAHEEERKVSASADKKVKGEGNVKRTNGVVENGWISVKRKPAKKKVTNKPPPRPDAIVIARAGTMTYSDILRVVKKDDALQELGENVTRIRKTAKGEILLQLKKEQMANTGVYQKKIGKVLGDQAQIKVLTHEMVVEIRDLDEITTKEDIGEAIRTQVNELNLFSENAIKSVRAAYAGTQTAVISLPALDARRLLEKQKLKIGWAVCRIREKPDLRRCYRCLEYGHLARACKNEDDRSQNCLKCGEKGHQAKVCEKKPFCGACKRNGREDTSHQNGSRKCPLYQAAYIKTKK
ncbi:uncharacterized protein LOC129249847 [Anastrepha obliqua]|uniref:uncharacterized protein LOC129249847 n=1 Tax=Anastrepha obliqua TaxID=95512 RepID=UPI00240A5538|nr:uncharacterized protein LOC129249847 [Anastrepha obliqua]